MSVRRSPRSARGSVSGSSGAFPDVFDDPELEIESIFQLNYEAASGELPQSQPGQSDLLPDMGGNATDVAPPSSQDNTTAAVSRSVIRSSLARIQDRRKGATRTGVRENLAHSQSQTFSSTFDDDDDQIDAPLMVRVRNPDEREAEASLTRSLQPFIVDERDAREDIPLPVALPMPIVGVCDNSALKTFCDQMIDHHYKMEIPLPSEEDVAQFLLRLPDNCPVHLQLPALAVPPGAGTKPEELSGFVQMGSLFLDPIGHCAQLTTTVQNHSFTFDMAHQSVSSNNAGVLVFQLPKESEESGTVAVLSVDMAASLTAQTKVKNLLNGERTTAHKDLASLDRIMKGKEDSIAADKKRKAAQLSSPDPNDSSGTTKEVFKRPRFDAEVFPLCTEFVEETLFECYSSSPVDTSLVILLFTAFFGSFYFAMKLLLHSSNVRYALFFAYRNSGLRTHGHRILSTDSSWCSIWARKNNPGAKRFGNNSVFLRNITKSGSFFEKDHTVAHQSRNYVLLVVPVLTFCLGVWQLRRLKWKLGLIDERTTRIRAPPLGYENLPASVDDIGDLEYRRVKLRGKFHHSHEIYLVPRTPITSVPAGGGLISSPTHGGRVITPFTISESNQTILVDRGWVPKARLDPATRSEGQVEGEVQVVGALRRSEKGSRFSPVHKEGSRNYAVRNIDLMAAELGVTPLLIEATKESSIPGGPLGGQTIIEMRNEHMNYAITWFSLSVITAFLWYYKYIKRKPFRYKLIWLIPRIISESGNIIATMDAGGCVPLPFPVVVRPTYDPNATVPLPAPCYLVGRKELVYIYFGSGFVIPILALIYVQFDRLRRFVLRNLKRRGLQCRQDNINEEFVPKPSDSDSDEMAQGGIKKSGVERMKLLMEAKQRQSPFMRFFTEAASPQSQLGQILMTIAVTCAAVSLCIYLSTVSMPVDSVETCGTLPNVYQALDFVANLYMLFYFIVRLIGNDKKIRIIQHSMHSIVDYFTIPPVMISVFLNRYFTGFSFFRAYNFLWIVDILSNRGVFRKTNTIKLAKLVFTVVSLLMIAAGFLHLVENMGDPWPFANKGTYNGQSISFWRCYLYLYGRVTLLDLSGMRIRTMLGRIIIYFFQILALGIVSKAIPQIILLVRITPEYDKKYETPIMFLHVIVCGSVNAAVMSSFLKEFYNKDRETSEYFKILILDEKEPDEDMRNLLEQYFNRLDYRRGTCMKLKDLNRVQLMDAEAVMILADRTAAESDAEDAANIMRVVAIKNYRERARIIVQILQYHNKAYLQNIPSWNPKYGDTVLCISELRLGLLAQSCCAPGFSTLMANFFTTRSQDGDTKLSEITWMDEYVRGTALELYSRPFSEAFYGMGFVEACEFCYRKLKIVLLAVQIKPSDPFSAPQVNPPSYVVICEGSRGYFIADSTKEVDRVEIYCRICHNGVTDLDLIKKCSCHSTFVALSRNGKLTKQQSNISRMLSCRGDLELEAKIWSFICQYPNTPIHGSETDIAQDVATKESALLQPHMSSEIMYDSTGMFHWCPARALPEIIMNRYRAAVTDFHNHIVVCVMAESSSQLIGLSSFVLPLRSSNIPYEELQEIIILGDVGYLEKEWHYIYNLPKLFIVKGSALNRADLRSINLYSCGMCVILGSPGLTEKKNSDSTMVDKNVILATLNVRSMRFSRAERDAVEAFLPDETPRETGYDIPLITDLMRDSNVQYLEQDDKDMPGTEFYCTAPYAGGRAFAASVLDLLTITSFFNAPIIKVFHAMIFGGASLELERIIAEGAGLIGGSNISQPPNMKDQIKIILLPLTAGYLQSHANSVYGALFLDALTSLGLIVLGVFRLTDSDADFPHKRYVITNPPEGFQLHPSDKVFALQRSDWLSMSNKITRSVEPF
ncbi:calcium-activated potassium channel slo-1-like [Paramacrobiotus metropolitanus]|uniref:calcium-activated potassium channel slo-1-like n=1 Tax=Paramacrobiotus metropolitanus TaxID=2943436 RepID=UPI0024464392|nr:calcium-activated potassium channel slo-1-like [Paramacrobiotus metropolitanus]